MLKLSFIIAFLKQFLIKYCFIIAFLKQFLIKYCFRFPLDTSFALLTDSFLIVFVSLNRPTLIFDNTFINSL